MNSVTVSLSSGPVTSDTVTSLSALNIKGQTRFTLDLTGLTETEYMVTTLDINWGDGSDTERYTKDLVVDYKTQSIFNEVLYGKFGSVAVPYTHIYNTLVDAESTTYDLNIVAYYENGYSLEFTKELHVYPESYYDSIRDIRIVSTQISPTADNYTVVNFETLAGSTFVAVLATEPIITSNLPINTSAPTIVGNPWSGMLLSASPGAWTASPSEYTYQWVVNGEAIVGAVQNTWTATDIFDQDSIEVIVTAINEFGQSTPKDSADLVGYEAPYEISPPIVTGVPILENTLFATVGVYGGSLTVKSLQWTKNGVDIAGQTALSLAISDAGPVHGDSIVARVSATNIVGTEIGYSTPKIVIFDPVYLSGGFISGNVIPGLSVQAVDPIWANDPTSLTREWYKNDIATGAGGIYYADTVGGDSVYASFSASNIAGIAGPIISNTITMMNAPTNSIAPILSGGNYLGGVLNVTVGTWVGSVVSYEYAWYRNDVVISGQTANTLDVSASGLMYDDEVYATVTAINEGGSSIPAASNAEMIIIAPMEDGSSIYYELSSDRGLLRYSFITMPSQSDASSIYYGMSTVQGLTRFSQIGLLSTFDASSIYYGTSTVQGAVRFSEVSMLSTFDASGIYYTLSVARGSLI